MQDSIKLSKNKEDKFIEGRGLGNEISFYVFDYEPEHELMFGIILNILKKNLIMKEQIDELLNLIYIKCY